MIIRSRNLNDLSSFHRVWLGWKVSSITLFQLCHIKCKNLKSFDYDKVIRVKNQTGEVFSFWIVFVNPGVQFWELMTNLA